MDGLCRFQCLLDVFFEDPDSAVRPRTSFGPKRSNIRDSDQASLWSEVSLPKSLVGPLELVDGPARCVSGGRVLLEDAPYW